MTTKFIALGNAAEELGVPVEDLLLMAAEGSIHLWALLNVQGEYRPDRPEGDGPDRKWVESADRVQGSLDFGIVSRRIAARLLQEPVARVSSAVQTPYAHDGAADGLRHWRFAPQKVRRQSLYVSRADRPELEQACATKGRAGDSDARPGSTGAVSASESRDYMSDQLVVLNRAAKEFWDHADRGEPDTQPSIAQVVQWLEQRGFAASLARKAATIIRPDWAHNGRKPEE